MFRETPRSAPRMSSLSAALMSAFVVFSLPSEALAQSSQGTSSAAHSYRLEAGPLTKTLDAIAAVSGRQINYDRDALRSAQAPAVQGTMSTSAAVSQALAGTGYVLSENDAGMLTIAPVATVQITARDEAEKSFKASRSDTATRSGADLHNVPASVTLITSKVLETQQVTNLQDALRNVSGINFKESPQRNPTFAVRGFTASSTTNGVRDNTAASTDVFGVERVEVLKGPQAILSGGDSDGGGVNVVLKKPSAEVVRDLTLQYGSRADKTVALDLSGPIDTSKRLTYRLIGVKRENGKNQALRHNEGSRCSGTANQVKATPDFFVACWVMQWPQPALGYCFQHRVGILAKHVDVLMQ